MTTGRNWPISDWRFAGRLRDMQSWWKSNSCPLPTEYRQALPRRGAGRAERAWGWERTAYGSSSLFKEQEEGIDCLLWRGNAPTNPHTPPRHHLAACRHPFSPARRSRKEQSIGLPTCVVCASCMLQSCVPIPSQGTLIQGCTALSSAKLQPIPTV